MDEEESMLLKQEGEESKVLPQILKLNQSQWWILVLITIFFLISAQAVAVLLGRFYFDKGGNSKWISTLVQTGGFPILYLPLCLLPATSHSSSSCSLTILVWIYLCLGLAIALDNWLYSSGLLFLSASTYSLLCARLVSFDDDSNSPSRNSKWSYSIGCLCTLLASLIYSLQLSLVQFSFEKILKRETFAMVLEMQIYTSLVASVVAVIGLFWSGEWNMLRTEMEEFHQGQAIYVLTLVGAAFSWQLGSLGALALIFLATSLFSNLIGTLSLIVTPLAAILVFQDNMTLLKIIAMFVAVLGVAFYMYQMYLDGLEVQVEQETQAD